MAERFVHGALAVCAASVRGEDHRYRGVVRQDDFAVALDPSSGGIVAAVADGVSSASASQIGATAAVNAAIEVVARGHSDAVVDWDEVARHAAWAVIVAAQAALGSPEPDPAIAEKVCATTLAVTRIAPGPDGFRATGCGIGDSGVVLLRDGVFQYLVDGKPLDADIASNAVVALPRLPEALPTFDIPLEVGDVILLATDGVLDPLSRGVGAVGDHFRSVCLDPMIGQHAFSAALDFSRETFDDDRTVIAIWVT